MRLTRARYVNNHKGLWKLRPINLRELALHNRISVLLLRDSERLLVQEKNALLGWLCSLKYLSQKFVSVNLFLVQKIRLNLFSGGRVLLDLTALLNHTPVNRFWLKDMSKCIIKIVSIWPAIFCKEKKCILENRKPN